MSCIFGIYKKRRINFDHFVKLLPNPAFKISTDKLYIAVYGNRHTLTFDGSSDKNSFCISGVPISQDAAKLLTTKDWAELLNNSTQKIKDLNGHFCGAYFKDNTLSLFTDKLGLKEFHIYEDENGFYFSSRLDYLLRLRKFEIDFAEFGSRWLSVNQLSSKSIIKNVFRLNCGTPAVIRDGICKIIPLNWIPQKSSTITYPEFSEKLRRLIFIAMNQNMNLSLGLSGGMDSRVILSYLLNSHYSNWNCHTFLTQDKMDVQITDYLFKNFGFSHKKIIYQTVQPPDIVSGVFEYIGRTYLCESGFNSRKLMSYDSFDDNEIIIDGGFGEIWRREFLARLYFLGQKCIKNHNYDEVKKHLALHRADIFNKEFLQKMEYGVYNQIENLLQSLPSVDEIGFGNWLDIVALKTRLPNYYGAEQSRLDDYVTSYMPFSQPYLLDNLLNLSCRIRKNNRLFKKIIGLNFPDLTNVYLAKGNISYPYHLTTLLKRIYFSVYRKIDNSNNGIDHYLSSLHEFALDSLHSTRVKEFAAYDYKNIFDKVSSFYKGNNKESKFVDWFLSFEIFRQILEH